MRNIISKPRIVGGSHSNLFDMPFHIIIDYLAERYPHNTAIKANDTTISYSILKEFSDTLGAALQKIGIKKGDAIGIALPNCSEYLITLLASMKVGAVSICNINYNRSEKELEYQLNDSYVKTLFITSDYYEKFLKLRFTTKINTLVVVNTNGNINDHRHIKIARDISAFHYSDFIRINFSAALEREKVTLEDTAILKYMMGTMYKLKKKIFTHADLNYMTQGNINDIFNIMLDNNPIHPGSNTQLYI